MSSYLGKYAEYYDIIYANKDYAHEAAFVDECFKRFGPGISTHILELACGTGRHARALEQLGHQVFSTDYSADLLAVAQRRASELGSAVHFELADMRNLALDKRDFAAAICLFDSIGYVQTDAAINQLLTGLKAHLAPGSLFVFEFWHAAAMRNHFDPIRVGRWDLEDGILLRVAQTHLDHERDLATVQYELLEIGEDGSFTRTSETQTNRFFTVQQMEALLEGAGFESLQYLNGYSWDEGIDENTWHVLCIARSDN